MKKINGLPSAEKKFFKGEIVKVNYYTVDVKLIKNGHIIQRRVKDISNED